MPITAIKTANIKPGNEQHHGHDISEFHDKIFLQRETQADGNKDSMRFLKAGAVASWYIQTEDAFLPETFPEIDKILHSATWGICESNSLHRFIRPALFIMVRGKEGSLSGKKDVTGLLREADATIDARDTAQFEALVRAVDIEGGQFVLRHGKGFPK